MGIVSSRNLFPLWHYICAQNKKCFLVVILGMSKAEVVKWCLDNSFELIEMISEEDEEDDEEGRILKDILYNQHKRYNYDR